MTKEQTNELDALKGLAAEYMDEFRETADPARLNDSAKAFLWIADQIRALIPTGQEARVGR